MDRKTEDYLLYGIVTLLSVSFAALMLAAAYNIAFR